MGGYGKEPGNRGLGIRLKVSAVQNTYFLHAELLVHPRVMTPIDALPSVDLLERSPDCLVCHSD